MSTTYAARIITADQLTDGDRIGGLGTVRAVEHHVVGGMPAVRVRISVGLSGRWLTFDAAEKINLTIEESK